MREQILSEIFQDCIWNSERKVEIIITPEKLQLKYISDKENLIDYEDSLSEWLYNSIPGEMMEDDYYEGQGSYIKYSKVNNELIILKGELNEDGFEVNIISKFTNEIAFYIRLFKSHKTVNYLNLKHLKIRSPEEIYIEYFQELGYKLEKTENIDAYEGYTRDIDYFRNKEGRGLVVSYPNLDGRRHDYSDIVFSDGGEYSWVDLLLGMQNNINDYNGFNEPY